LPALGFGPRSAWTAADDETARNAIRQHEIS
jgi:hypothetical protein